LTACSARPHLATSRILNNRFRHNKPSHRGLNKNHGQLHTLFALADLVIVKQALPARAGR
jgi:hypothetical protein